MRSLLRAFLASGALLAVACGGSSTPATDVETAVTAAPAARTPTAAPIAPTEAPADLMSELSLQDAAPSRLLPIEDLAPNVATLLDASAGPIGVAVVVPETGAVYVGGESRPFALASAVKVPVMLAVLERARAEGRALTRAEEQRIHAMITQSDNASTTALWADLGRGAGVEARLAPYGEPRFDWGSGNFWGDTAASPDELALLLAQILDADALDEGDRARALALLQGVAIDQRWGISAGLNLDDGSGVHLGIKDGWYRETTGWRLTSTGLVLTNGGPDYAVVILTDRQPVFEDGVWTLERIAAEIHHALLPQAMTAELSLTDFASAEPTSEALVAADGDDGDAAASATPTATPAPSLAFRPLEGAPGVLVPVAAVPIARERQDAAISFWFQVPGATGEVLIQQYRAAMEQAGWSVQSAGAQLTLTNGGGYVTAGAHDQPNQAVLNLVVSLPHTAAAATLGP